MCLFVLVCFSNSMFIKLGNEFGTLECEIKVRTNSGQILDIKVLAMPTYFSKYFILNEFCYMFHLISFSLVSFCFCLIYVVVILANYKYY